MPASVYDELLAWSGGLQLWQRDALRRVVRSDFLTPREVEEIAGAAYAAAFDARGVELVSEVVPSLAGSDEESGELAPPVGGHPLGFLVVSPVALAAAHVPTRSTTAPAIRLKELRHVSGVNRLCPDAAVPFAPDGLNLVFGFNGVGKSGYTRILKLACHSRGPEDILADVYADTPASPRAAVTYLEGEDERTHSWDLDKDSPDVNLPRVAVYDHRSARVHVQRNGAQVELMPPGVDALGRLADAYRAVAKWVEQERARLAATASPPIVVTAKTPAVRAALDALGAVGAVAAVETVASLSAEELAEHSRLPAEIAELELGSVRSRAAAAAHREASCRTQAANLTAAVAQFETAQVDALVEAIADHAAMSSQIAQAPPAASEALAGVHGAHWEALWEAALTYAGEDAYPDLTYPSAQTPLCVLCHQPLDDAALERLSRLAREAQDGASAQLRRIERAHTALVNGMSQSISTAAIDDALLDTLPGDRSDDVAQAVAAITAARTVLAALRAGSAPREISAEEGASLRALSLHLAGLEAVVAAEADLAKHAVEVLAGQTDNPALVADKRERLAAFGERIELANAAADLRRLHNAKARQAALAEVGRQCGTDGVSRKSTALSSDYVQRICDTFAEETVILGARHLKVAMEPLSTVRGTRRTGIVLSGASNTRVGIEDVLSEGELRVVSLAAFLADVRISEDDSAIIFDDPMTSLDHRFQEKIAKRLVKEARTRQVLVFTHSSAFVTALFTAQEEDPEDQVLAGIDPPHPVPFETVEITKDRASGYAGVRVESFLAPSNRVNRIVTHLDDLVVAARRLWEAGAVDEYERATENFATHLRRAWESGVEDLLLNQVVLRNRAALKTEGRLVELIGITAAEVAAVNRGIDVESFFVHSTPDGAEKDSPDPDELQQKVSDFRSWAATVRSRRKDVKAHYAPDLVVH